MTIEPRQKASDHDTMTAIVQEAYGTADVFRLERVRQPDIADQEVLVRVGAAGLDRGTWQRRPTPPGGRPNRSRRCGGHRRDP